MMKRRERLGRDDHRQTGFLLQVGAAAVSQRVGP